VVHPRAVTAGDKQMGSEIISSSCDGRLPLYRGSTLCTSLAISSVSGTVGRASPDARQDPQSAASSVASAASTERDFVEFVQR